jgi:SAM-dependent MidA family methyltransferase
MTADEEPDLPPAPTRWPCPAWLAERFPADGTMTFEGFVEIVLHDPENGYYGRGVEVVGPEGDFVTGSTLDPAFARAMLRFAAKVDRAIGHPDRFDFVEVGAGSGRFLESLLRQADSVAPPLAPRLRFTAVERSPGLRKRIETRVAGEEKRTRTLASIDDVETGRLGIFFSYELFDALPFARLIGRGEPEPGEEVVVLDRREGSIRVEVAEPSPGRGALLAADGILLEEGQEAEVTPAAAPLLAAMAERLERGAIVTFDYGARARALYNPAGRFHGTATAHFRHRAHRGLLESPGEQDLTAHVNFSALERTGERLGFRTERFCSQARFLLEEGDFAREIEECRDLASRSNLFRLIEPDGMGDDLRVLVQTKDRS